LSRYLLTVDAEQDVDLIKDYLLLQGGTGLAPNLPGYIQKRVLYKPFQWIMGELDTWWSHGMFAVFVNGLRAWIVTDSES